MFNIKRAKSPQRLIETHNAFLKLVNGLDKEKAYQKYNDVKTQQLYKYKTEETETEFAKMNFERCSFCGRLLLEFKDEMTVEHIEPKVDNPSKIFEWDNLLCSCLNCNRKRSTNKYIKEKYLDPTKDDVSRYFDYKSTGKIVPSEKLEEIEKAKAQYMINLYKLDRDALQSRRKKFFLQLSNDDFRKNLGDEIETNEHILFLGQYLKYKEGANDE